MQFVYEAFAGNEILELKDELYNYLIKVRRHKISDEIAFRNLKDDKLYFYKLNFIDKKKAILSLFSSEEKLIENHKKLHLAWAIIDPKIIEKNISSLNEIGVDKITLFYSDFSQKNFKINIEKLEKILINSSSQCGRSSIIKLELCKNLEDFLKENKEAYILDFSNNILDSQKDDIKTLIIGPEGGFSQRERKLFDENFILGFDTKLILRSESAAICASSKIIL